MEQTRRRYEPIVLAQWRSSNAGDEPCKEIPLEFWNGVRERINEAFLAFLDPEEEWNGDPTKVGALRHHDDVLKYLIFFSEQLVIARGAGSPDAVKKFAKVIAQMERVFGESLKHLEMILSEDQSEELQAIIAESSEVRKVRRQNRGQPATKSNLLSLERLRELCQPVLNLADARAAVYKKWVLTVRQEKRQFGQTHGSYAKLDNMLALAGRQRISDPIPTSDAARPIRGRGKVPDLASAAYGRPERGDIEQSVRELVLLWQDIAGFPIRPWTSYPLRPARGFLERQGRFVRAAFRGAGFRPPKNWSTYRRISRGAEQSIVKTPLMARYA